jgi:hypothetical protein
LITMLTIFCCHTNLPNHAGVLSLRSCLDDKTCLTTKGTKGHEAKLLVIDPSCNFVSLVVCAF